MAHTTLSFSTWKHYINTWFHRQITKARFAKNIFHFAIVRVRIVNFQFVLLVFTFFGSSLLLGRTSLWANLLFDSFESAQFNSIDGAPQWALRPARAGASARWLSSWRSTGAPAVGAELTGRVTANRIEINWIELSSIQPNIRTNMNYMDIKNQHIYLYLYMAMSFWLAL